MIAISDKICINTGYENSSSMYVAKLNFKISFTGKDQGELFTMDQIVGFVLLENSFRNLAGIRYRANEGLRLDIVFL